MSLRLSRPAVAAALLAAALAVTGACQERRWTRESVGQVPDGAFGTSVAEDAAAAPGAVDAAVRPDGCSGGAPETCNGLDDDCNGLVDDVAPGALRDDPLQCGACGVVCVPAAHSVAVCQAGQCLFRCQDGYVDVNRSRADGCECAVTGAVELCDGKDNDCDGNVDEGFDLDTDPLNCGTCNRRCTFAFASGACNRGACVLTGCLAGYFDRNGIAADGCESACGKTNGGVEICDGLDNDCNGKIDDNLPGPPPSFRCKSDGVCAGATERECRETEGGLRGWVCVYGPDHQEVEDGALGCDGKDNDCDGKTDEAFDVGRACTVGRGACIEQGQLACDPADRTRTRCTASPGPPGLEICNGVDDDCDGAIDELVSASDRTFDDKLVYLPPPIDVTMFAHEASRSDASAVNAGESSGLRPCSLPGRLPWANVTKEEARDACRAIGGGWRLCTKDEWFGGCSRGGVNAYPYGPTYDRAACNGADYAPDPAVVATGAAARCVARPTNVPADALFDLSGNVREWVLTPGAAEAFELRGGAYNVASYDDDAPGLRCSAALPAPSPAVRLPSVGFRCCHPGRLPP